MREFLTPEERSAALLYSDEEGNYDRMEQHAIRYYDAVRSRDRTEEITKVTNNLGVSRDIVEDAYQHIFYDLHLDHRNNLTRFDCLGLTFTN